MKNINNFISEKLKLNSQSKLKPLKWSIETAERGDIITIDEGSKKYVFIFKEVDKEDDDKIRSIAAISIHTALYKIYLYYNPHNQTDYFFTKHDSKFRLSTEKEKQLLFNKLKDAHYIWDPIKKEIEKI